MKRIGKAFTLIELLVVIAIIAILAAILFPVFAQAKLSAKKAADLSNIKQEDLALIMYSTDNDDYFPCVVFGAINANGSWNDAAYYYSYLWSSGECVGPYTKNTDLLLNPIDSYTLDNLGSTYPSTRPIPKRISYMPNIVNVTLASYFPTINISDPRGPIQPGPYGEGMYSTTDPGNPMSQTQANHPADVILLADGRPDFEVCVSGYDSWTNNEILWYPTWTMGGIGGYGWDIQAITWNYAAWGTPNCYNAWRNFSGGANFAFVDGHAKLQRPGDLMTGEYPNPLRWLMNDPD